MSVSVCIGVYLSFPASVDEGTDWSICSSATCVQMCPVPWLDHTHKVGTLPLGCKCIQTNMLSCALCIAQNELNYIGTRCHGLDVGTSRGAEQIAT